MLKSKKVIWFIIINIALILGASVLANALHMNIRSFSMLYMFFPMIASIIIAQIFDIDITELGLQIKLSGWFLIAWILPFIITILTLAISLLFPEVEFSAIFEGMTRYGVAKELLVEKFSGVQISPILTGTYQGLIAGATINLLFAFGEEIGWRGLLYKELRGFGFWRSSFFIGALWGIWHFPVIVNGHNYPQNPQVGAFLWIVICIAMSPIFTLVRDKTESVIAAALFHGTLNALAGISIGAAKGGTDLIVGLPGLSGLIVFTLINLAILMYRSKKGQVNVEIP